jgi:hypothetical protein
MSAVLNPAFAEDLNGRSESTPAAVRNSSDAANEAAVWSLDPDGAEPAPLQNTGERRRRRFLVGVAIGGAVPTDADGYEPGVHVDALQLAFLFNRYVGIQTTMALGAYGDEYKSAGLIGAWIGPLFSVPLNRSGKVNLELYPAIGFAQGVVGDYTTENDFSMRLGAGFRFHAGRTVYFTLGGHYIYGQPGSYDLSYLGIIAGIGFNF